MTEEARYWNEEGGQRWVAHIDRLERMLVQFSKHLVEAVAARPGEHVLDIGCGGGPTSAAYARQVGAQGRVLGLDISDVILDVARQRYAGTAGLSFETADAASYVFRPPLFDVITSRYGVMFFPDPVAAFSNIRTAGKAGARLHLLVWRSIDDNPWMGETARAAFTVLTAPEKLPPGSPGPFSLADPDRVDSVLGSAGFSDVRMREINEDIVLGNTDDALDWLTKMGPAARPLEQASEADAQAARAAMRQVLENHERDGAVTFNGGAWLISARLS